MVTCKPSVRFKRFTPAMLWLLNTLSVADETKVEGQPEDLVITSANDSTHIPASKHYTDAALDIRSKTFPPHSKESFRRTLQWALGSKFRVLLEGRGTPNEHFHCQVRKGQSFP